MDLLYELGELLGKGGFGDVFAARHISTNEDVAIKIIKNRDDSDFYVAMNEVEAARHMGHHQNIINLKEARGDKKRGAYLVYERMEETLLDAMKAKRTNTKSIMLQLLCGLEHAHGCGVIHCDLKPENILLNGDRLCIGDFGMSCPEHRAKAGEISTYITTRWYRAPEMMYEESKETGFTAAIDIWSAGVIFCELLSGVPPFRGRDSDDQRNIISRFFSSKKSVRDLVPPDTNELVTDLLQQMITEDPSRRISASNALKHQYFK